MITRIFGNWHTTLFGTLAGFFLYLNEQGLVIPSDTKGLKAFAMAVGVAMIGYLAKDAKTGSAPND